MSKSTTFRTRYTDAIWSENALRAPERLVALAYVKYAGARDPRTHEKAPEDVAWVEWVTLSTMTGIRSKTALSRCTRALVEAGWMVQVEPARQHRAPRYQLVVPRDPDRRLTVVPDAVETA